MTGGIAGIRSVLPFDVIYELRRVAGAALLSLKRLDTSLHFLAWHECHDESLRDKHPFASPRVPSVACCPLLDFEHAETPQLDATFRDKRRHDGINRLLDDFLGLQAGEPG